jgi:hypothetical protein
MSGKVPDYIVARYLNTWRWPICKSGERERKCGDNFGDIECPFCDKVLCAEYSVLRIGDNCSCGAEVVRFNTIPRPY